MKNKGFTLIELLAVIVVLAIIALIATPIVMNTIKKSQKGAAERSADNYIEAVETAVATSRLDNEGVSDGTYTINDEGNLEGNGLKNPLTIEMNGNKPTSGVIVIKDGQVTTDSKMTIGSYEVAYNPTNKKYEATEKDSSSLTVVYRWSSDNLFMGDIINPDDSTKYTKDPTTLLTNPIAIEKGYYLKHVLDKNNKIIEMYVCALFNNEEVCLRGGDSSFYGYAENEADYTGNALILKKLRNNGFNCEFGSVYSLCSSGSVRLDAYSNGHVAAFGTDYSCGVYDDEAWACSIQ